MCQSRQFAVTPEEKNLFSKNDKNAKNSQSQNFSHKIEASVTWKIANITFCRRCFVDVAFDGAIVVYQKPIRVETCNSV